MNKISKHLISFAILAFLFVPLLTLPAAAQTTANFGLDNVNEGLDGTLSNSDPRAIIGRIINVALGFLGVIAVAIILLGGFKWMTAGGNEEKIESAKKLLTAAIIGLVIILLAWAIVIFAIGVLSNAT